MMDEATAGDYGDLDPSAQGHKVCVSGCSILALTWKSFFDVGDSSMWLLLFCPG